MMDFDMKRTLVIVGLLTMIAAAGLYWIIDGFPTTMGAELHEVAPIADEIDTKSPRESQ